MYKFDFAWGDTRGVREVMMKHASFLKLPFPWETFGYPPHMGTPELRDALAVLIEYLTGKKYAHILVTNGATNALNAYVYAAKTQTTKFLHTHKLYFSRYPGIAANFGLTHAKVKDVEPKLGDIGIVDSPSNPEGRLIGGGSKFSKVIWDAAYYTPTYCGIKRDEHLLPYPIIPFHEAMAGSLSKLTGINGIRIGWLATDDVLLYNRALDYLTSNLCGVSQPSQYAAHQILTKVDLDNFFVESKALIDNNKEEVAKLDYLFGHQEVPRYGMFALFEVDSKLLDLLERASVKVMPGSQCGDDKQSVRFNLGNSNKETAEMVKAILKVDGK